MAGYGVNPIETWFHERRQKNIHMSYNEILEAVRLAVIAELDTINYYEQVANATRDEQVKRVFMDVIKEKTKLIGVFLALLSRLDPQFSRLYREGIKTVEERLAIKVEL
ncbi:MAG: hypothetical protein F7C35_08725 [Desulfurococcales archaeon]|nr:hypothetical protein [Desulfurococcales archaeon]